MHHLSYIKIENFRSCRDVEMELGDCTPLVGYNNAGKSNLLDAIRWFAEPWVLQKSDFLDPEAVVAVEGRLEGVGQAVLASLEDRHRKKIEEFLNREALRFRRLQEEPGGKISDLVIEIWAVGESSTEPEWRKAPTGIPNAISALFPAPIKIGAMEDAPSDASEGRSSSTIGRILSELTQSVQKRHENELAEPLAALADRLGHEGPNRLKELQRFDEESSRAVGEFFSGIRLKLGINTPRTTDLLGKGSVRIESVDGTTTRPFETLGHGAQRSVQMGLIRYLAEIRQQKSGGARRRILMVEEPELYLHPQGVKKLREALDSLAASGYQIVYATHSPFMIAKDAAQRTRIVRKEGDTGDTRVIPTAQEALEKRGLTTDKRLHSLFAPQNTAEWLFSDRVLLVEGQAEEFLLPVLFEAIAGRTLMDAGIAIVNLHSANEIPDSLSLLTELGIAVQALADLDFAVNVAPGCFLDEKDQDLLEYRSQIVGRENGKSQGKQKAKVVTDWANTPEGESIADKLHEKLLKKDIWVWPRGDFEHHLGTSGKDKELGTWYAFQCYIEDCGWESVVRDPLVVGNFVDWLETKAVL